VKVWSVSGGKGTIKTVINFNSTIIIVKNEVLSGLFNETLRLINYIFFCQQIYNENKISG
jgi:hypothetical protein